MTGRCTTSCMTDTGCTCGRSARRRAYDVASLDVGRIIPARWTSSILTEPPDDDEPVPASWPGGIGETPCFGEAA